MAPVAQVMTTRSLPLTPPPGMTDRALGAGATLQLAGELCDGMAMTRQAVTKHLALLEDANLVAIVWRGREKLHYLNPVPIHEISERWISKYERGRLSALSGLKKALESDDDDK